MEGFNFSHHFFIDGKPARIKASTRAIRNGLVVKPLKRKYGWTRQQKAAGAVT